MNSLPKTVTRQRRDCDLNPGPSAPESSTLTTRLPWAGRYPPTLLLSLDDAGSSRRVPAPNCTLVCSSSFVGLAVVSNRQADTHRDCATTADMRIKSPPNTT